MFLLRLGFVERVRGSHHIFRKEGVRERINLQRDGSHAKPYQVRQVRQVVHETPPRGEAIDAQVRDHASTGANEDVTFVAEVPELPGCMAHGDTQEAALQHVNDAMDLWIETARELVTRSQNPRANA